MSQAARVLSVQALTDFRGSMYKFVEEARNSLSGVDMELRRMRDWLERDQLGYWQMQVKRRQEIVMNARAELAKRKIAAQGNDSVSDTDQKERLREAQRKLDVAEEKVKRVKQLIPVLQHAMAEYKSCASPLNDHLSGGMERSLARLDNMVKALEEYLALRAPSTPRMDAPGSASAAGGSAASGSVAAPTATGQTEAGAEPATATAIPAAGEAEQAETASAESL